MRAEQDLGQELDLQMPVRSVRTLVTACGCQIIITHAEKWLAGCCANIQGQSINCGDAEHACAVQISNVLLFKTYINDEG